MNIARVGDGLMWFTAASSVIALLGLVLMVIIAWRQRMQLRHLERITEKVGADQIVRRNSRRFFGSSLSSQGCDCFCTVAFPRRPTPEIAAGDYHASQVLTSRIGPDLVRLHMIHEGYDAHPLRGRINVLVGGAWKNPVLKQYLPPWRLDRDGAVVKTDRVEGLTRELHQQLPCWFAEDVKNNVKSTTPRTASRERASFSERPRRRIARRDRRGDLFSTRIAELYKEAENLQNGERFEPFFDPEPWDDFGILARLSIGKRWWFVVGGIHEPGTWIAGDLLDRLLRGEAFEYSNMLLENHDFVAVVWGEFDTKALHVTRSGIHQQWLWQKVHDRWRQVTPQ